MVKLLVTYFNSNSDISLLYRESVWKSRCLFCILQGNAYLPLRSGTTSFQLITDAMNSKNFLITIYCRWIAASIQCRDLYTRANETNRFLHYKLILSTLQTLQIRFHSCSKSWFVRFLSFYHILQCYHLKLQYSNLWSADAREPALHVHVTIRERDRSGAGAWEAHHRTRCCVGRLLRASRPSAGRWRIGYLKQQLFSPFSAKFVWPLS